MRKKTAKLTGRTQNRSSNVSLFPLTPDQAMKAVLSISKEDAKRIVASKPGKKR
jgi:hypothetical protein